jgi:Icc-related predicted phosphoesterase
LCGILPVRQRLGQPLASRDLVLAVRRALGQDRRVRILVATDLHYRLGHYDWLVNAAETVDVVAITGDLADVASPVPVEVQVVVLDRYLDLLAEQAVVLAASGNHDLDGPGASGEQVAGWLRRRRDGRVHTDGTSVDLDGIRFTVCPWWDGPQTKAAVGDQLRVAAEGRPPRWVWLYHAPPGGTVLCRDGHREFPDNDLTAWIGSYEPDVVLTGHIHQAPWVDGGSWHDRVGRTTVFNPGKQVGKIPPHLSWDTETGVVEWFGVFSTETVTLP